MNNLPLRDMEDNFRKRAIYLLVIILVALPIFLHLGVLPIRLYDESRLATNAVEMAQSNSWLVTTFEHKPDLWNTKPPLMIWLQAAGIKLLGINEWAIRLPAALAAVATCLLLFLFSRRMLYLPATGIIAAIVLISAKGYVDIHGIRTGDYDALLVFFTTFASLSFFAWTENGEKRNLLLFFVALTMAALTKGIAGLLFLPGVAVYTLYRRKLIPLFKSPAFYLGILVFITVVGGYYMLREQALPGYLLAVYENELGGRFLKPLETHTGSFWFYMKALVAPKFLFGLPLVLLALVFIKRLQNELNRRLIIYLTSVGVCFLLVISIAQTKLGWYDLPLYPLLSLQAAIFIYDILYLQLWPWVQRNGSVAAVAFITAAFVLAVIPYLLVMDKIIRSEERSDEASVYSACYYLREEMNTGQLPARTAYVSWQYSPHLEFYISRANALGIPIRKKGMEEILPRERVITNDEAIAKQIESTYSVGDMVHMDGVSVYDIPAK